MWLISSLWIWIVNILQNYTCFFIGLFYCTEYKTWVVFFCRIGQCFYLLFDRVCFFCFFLTLVIVLGFLSLVSQFKMPFKNFEEIVAMILFYLFFCEALFLMDGYFICRKSQVFNIGRNCIIQYGKVNLCIINTTASDRASVDITMVNLNVNVRYE